MAMVVTKKGEWGRGYAGTRSGGGSCGFGGGALGGYLGNVGSIFGGFEELELRNRVGWGWKAGEGNHLSVVNLLSLNAAMKAGERRKARRLRLP